MHFWFCFCETGEESKKKKGRKAEEKKKRKQKTGGGCESGVFFEPDNEGSVIRTGWTQRKRGGKRKVGGKKRGTG